MNSNPLCLYILFDTSNEIMKLDSANTNHLATATTVAYYMNFMSTGNHVVIICLN